AVPGGPDTLWEPKIARELGPEPFQQGQVPGGHKIVGSDGGVPLAGGAPPQDRRLPRPAGPGGVGSPTGWTFPKGGRGFRGGPALGVGGPAPWPRSKRAAGTFRGGPAALSATALFLLCPWGFPDRYRQSAKGRGGIGKRPGLSVGRCRPSERVLP